MTTLTGVWGNVVVRNNELVPFNTDKFMDAINIDRGYSPLYEYFPDPIDKIISLLLLVAGECPEGVL
jgi:hypothetical protein